MSDFGQSIAGSRGAPNLKPGVRAGSGDNASRNRKALKKLSLLELTTGRSPEQWDAWHSENRERVRKRWLKDAA